MIKNKKKKKKYFGVLNEYKIMGMLVWARTKEDAEKLFKSVEYKLKLDGKI